MNAIETMAFSPTVLAEPRVVIDRECDRLVAELRAEVLAHKRHDDVRGVPVVVPFEVELPRSPWPVIVAAVVAVAAGVLAGDLAPVLVAYVAALVGVWLLARPPAVHRGRHATTVAVRVSEWARFPGGRGGRAARRALARGTSGGRPGPDGSTRRGGARDGTGLTPD